MLDGFGISALLSILSGKGASMLGTTALGLFITTSATPGRFVHLPLRVQVSMVAGMTQMHQTIITKV